MNSLIFGFYLGQSNPDSINLILNGSKPFNMVQDVRPALTDWNRINRVA